MKLNFTDRLTATIRGRLGPAHVVNTDEARVIARVMSVAVALGYNVWLWSMVKGLWKHADSKGNVLDPDTLQRDRTRFDNLNAPNALLGALGQWGLGPSIVVALDFAPIINATGPGAIPVARQIRDLSDAQQQATDAKQAVQLVMLGAEAPAIDCGSIALSLELPDRAECGRLLDEICSVLQANADNAPDAASRDKALAVIEQAGADRDRILNAVAGLPANAISNALAESIVRSGSIDPALLIDYKRSLVSAKGLEIVDGDPRGFDAIGGMTPAKDWFRRRARAFTPEAKAYGITPPKGVNFSGLPGGGKSALFKALIAEWGFTGLRADLAATRGKFQGDAETALQDILQTAEAVAPCIVQVDEIEKALAGSQGSGDTDGGTASRALGTLLTWMQECTAPVFMYFTANRPDMLPPELTRAGRIDANFWVDVPTLDERRAIAEVYTAKFDKARNVDPVAVAAASEGNMGSEIEAAYKEALMIAFEAGREVETADVTAQLGPDGMPRVSDTFTLREGMEAWKKAATPANDAPAATSQSNAPRRVLSLTNNQ